MITYRVNNGLYVNITNKCSNSCDFCVRSTVENYYGNLWLDREPEAEKIKSAVLEALDGTPGYGELVFCGYGEPTCRFDAMMSVCAAVKAKYPSLPIRINTNGQGNLINGRDITPEMQGLVDCVSVSLNTADSVSYQKICHSVYGEEAYNALIEFATAAGHYVKTVVLSVVETTIPDADIEKCRSLAEKCGATLRVRPFISD